MLPEDTYEKPGALALISINTNFHTIMYDLQSRGNGCRADGPLCPHRSQGKGPGLHNYKSSSGRRAQTAASELRRLGLARGIKFFLRDAGNLEKSDACVLIGSKSSDHVGLDCGGCGFATCQEMLEAQKQLRKKLEKPFRGPNCVIKMADLGIALGSAAKTASLHNVDNRVMFTAGVAALSLGWLEGCSWPMVCP